MKSPAVFFDRDKTLIEDPGYINDPELVRLHEDAAEAIVRFRRAGYRIVAVTNQSGVARGLITEEQLAAVHRRLQDLLAARGAPLDAVYACPYLDGPEATVEAYRRKSRLRKPEPGMLLQAAEDLRLDLRRSWSIGDRARDVEAGHRAGCRTVLVEREGPDPDGRSANPTHVVQSLLEAANMVLAQDEQTERTESTPTQSDSQPAVDSGRQIPDGGSQQVLFEIRDLLDRMARRRRQEDFSLKRLCGTLLQMVAVLMALWGLAGLFADQADAATARFALAVFLQLATLTIIFAERRG